jgi:hypothetical protein
MADQYEARPHRGRKRQLAAFELQWSGRLFDPFTPNRISFSKCAKLNTASDAGEVILGRPVGGNLAAGQ